MVPVEARGGVSIADAPGRNHCLECGDCIRACEWIIDAKGNGPVPLLLGHYRGPQRIEAEK
jgi:ferredoxin